MKATLTIYYLVYDARITIDPEEGFFGRRINLAGHTGVILHQRYGATFVRFCDEWGNLVFEDWIEDGNLKKLMK
jgi:hypothetical protein